MASTEKAVMYKVGARFYYGKAEEDGREPVMFSYRIDGTNEIEREATDEDKAQYPREYLEFSERPKAAAEEAKQAVKDAEELAKKTAATLAEDKKREAAAKKAKDDKEEEDKKAKADKNGPTATKTTVTATTVKK